MSKTRQARRFQVHLSTAVVLMFAAGVLIWANVTMRGAEADGAAYRLIPISASGVNPLTLAGRNFPSYVWVGEYEYGWPYAAVTVSKTYLAFEGVELPGSAQPITVRPRQIVQNALVALLILFAVGLAGEWWIRRRAAGKGA